jgi:Uncharacterized conserved protein (DUF2190)
MSHVIQGRMRYAPGCDITCKTTIAVVKERFVKITATHDITIGENVRIGPCGAGEMAYGVPRHDAAIDTLVTVRLVSSGSTMGIETGAALTFGQPVMSDALGRAIPYVAGPTNNRLGTCLANAASGAIADIDLHY